MGELTVVPHIPFGYKSILIGTHNVLHNRFKPIRNALRNNLINNITKTDGTELGYELISARKL